MKSRIMKSTVSIVLAISILFSLACCFIVNAQAQSGYVTNVGSGFHLKIRKGPGTNFDRVQYNGADTYLCDGDSVTVLDIVDASANDNSGCSQWYKIRFLFKGQTLEGYAASAYIYIIPDTDVTVPDDIPSIYKPYIEQLLKAHPNWKFVIYDTGYDWNSLFSTGSNGQGYPGRSLISYNYPLSYRSTASGNYDWRNDKWIAHDSNQWYQANTQTIAYYMDPRNFLTENTVFMFESLSYDSTTQKIDGVTSILKGSFMEGKSITSTSGTTVSYPQAYIDAAVYSKVSPYHLASRTIQEVGKSGSGSTSGTYSGYEGYYNYYNIGATQGTSPIANGLKFAKTGGSMSDANKQKCLIPWNTPYKSIVGGGYWIGMSYINSSHKQNTLYFQKFNTSNPSSSYFYHQYMGNIMAPAHEAPSIRKSYISLGILDNSFTFIIPYYKNMPSTACTLPAKNNNSPNNWLKTLSVDGYSISFDAAQTSGYSITVPASVSSVKVNATPVNSYATVSGAGTVSLKAGSNTVSVTVTAQNGDKRVYTINVTRSTQEKIPLKGISLSATSLSMFKGDSKQLSVTYNPSNTTDNKTVTWSSSNTSVATVSNGKVTAVGKGEATITAKVGSFTATCKVTVTDECKLGDIDADGDITIADALMIFKYKTGEITLSASALAAADTDKNGAVELADALRIFKFKSGEISAL